MFYQSKKDRDLDFFEEESFCDKKNVVTFTFGIPASPFLHPHIQKKFHQKEILKKTLKPRKRNCAQTFFKVDKYVKK